MIYFNSFFFVVVVLRCQSYNSKNENVSCEAKSIIIPKLPDLLEHESIQNGSRNPWPSGVENKLCHLKIFVYNISLTNSVAKLNGECRHILWGYGSEYILWKQLLDENGEINKQYVTKSPEEANLFFIPFLGSCYLWKGKNPDVDENYVVPLMNWVKSEYPYWNRSNGKDHIIVFPMDMSYCHYKKSYHLFKSAIFLTSLGDRRINASCFRPHRDIVIPTTTRLIHMHKINISAYLDNQGNPIDGKRDILALFVGSGNDISINSSYSIGIRHLIFHYYRKLKGYAIYDRVRFQKYANLLSHAKYGLIPPGWQLWTDRLTEILHFGVVPVILSDGIILPFEYDVSWDIMTVRIPRSRAHEIDEILKSISQEEYEYKRQNVWKYGRSISLNNDAWHYIVRDLCRLTDSNNF